MRLYIHYIIIAVITILIVVLSVKLFRDYSHDGGTVQFTSEEAEETEPSTKEEVTSASKAEAEPETETLTPYVSPIEWIDGSVGAIQITGANDGLPLYIMYLEGDDEFYLYHDVYGEESVKGSIFADGYIDFDTADIRILYGHHMKDGSMFAVIDDYAVDEELFDSSEIRLYYPDHEEDLYPICAIVGASDGNLRHVNSPETLAEFAQGKTLSAGRIPRRFGGRLYCLVTCNYWANNNRTYAFYYGRRRDVEEEKSETTELGENAA